MKTLTGLPKFTCGMVSIGMSIGLHAFAQASPPPLPPLPPAPPGFSPSLQTVLTPPAPPSPGAAQTLPPKLGTPTVVTPTVIPPPTVVPPPAAPIVVAPPPITQPAQPANPGALVWDSEQKEYKAKFGEANATFTFFFTNVSASEVVINRVQPSCGCTTAKTPPVPWHVAAGTNYQIDLNVNLAGKNGTVVKSVTVDSTAGVKSLILRVDIPSAPTNDLANGLSGVRSEAERASNMQSALADRQAIFKGDCAKCHVEPTVGKLGKELYVASCGICHEAEHRATMVPDLKTLPHPTNADFWKLMITSGKPGTLMPAFAQKEGGNLSDEQINSLVQFLVQTMPANPQTAPPTSKSASAFTPSANPNISALPVPKPN